MTRCRHQICSWSTFQAETPSTPRISWLQVPPAACRSSLILLDLIRSTRIHLQTELHAGQQHQQGCRVHTAV